MDKEKLTLLGSLIIDICFCVFLFIGWSEIVSSLTYCKYVFFYVYASDYLLWSLHILYFSLTPFHKKSRLWATIMTYNSPSFDRFLFYLFLQSIQILIEWHFWISFSPIVLYFNMFVFTFPPLQKNVFEFIILELRTLFDYQLWKTSIFVFSCCIYNILKIISEICFKITPNLSIDLFYSTYIRNENTQEIPIFLKNFFFTLFLVYLETHVSFGSSTLSLLKQLGLLRFWSKDWQNSINEYVNVQYPKKQIEDQEFFQTLLLEGKWEAFYEASTMKRLLYYIRYAEEKSLSTKLLALLCDYLNWLEVYISRLLALGFVVSLLPSNYQIMITTIFQYLFYTCIKSDTHISTNLQYIFCSNYRHKMIFTSLQILALLYFALAHSHSNRWFHLLFIELTQFIKNLHEYIFTYLTSFKQKIKNDTFGIVFAILLIILEKNILSNIGKAQLHVVLALNILYWIIYLPKVKSILIWVWFWGNFSDFNIYQLIVVSSFIYLLNLVCSESENLSETDRTPTKEDQTTIQSFSISAQLMPNSDFVLVDTQCDSLPTVLYYNREVFPINDLKFQNIPNSKKNPVQDDYFNRDS